MTKKNWGKNIWTRAIILVDMNAFFASIEQLDQPKLRNKPVCVTNGEQGSCIITCSYEARAFGIKTGMRLKEAKQRCPHLLRCPSRPKRYAEVSRNIMQALETITPDLEIFSIDEAFLDVTHCQQLHGDPIRIGKLAKRKVWEASQLTCSIGISGDKTTAKFAAKLQKPDGFTIIPPWEAKRRLHDIPVTELCGIGSGIGNFLKRYGVITCGDMQHLPISVLGKRFGNFGRRIWYMCQGADPEPIKPNIPDPKSMGHGKVLPPGTRDAKTILIYLQHMSEKLAKRLRKNHLEAQYFFIGLRTEFYSWLGSKIQLPHPCNDGKILFQCCQQIMHAHWPSQSVVTQVQVTALDPKPCALQQDLFTIPDEKRNKLNHTMDAVNRRFGDYSCTPATLLNKSKMPNVIAPAWKPSGHRENIEE